MSTNGNIPKQNTRDGQQPNKTPSVLLFDNSGAFTTDKSLIIIHISLSTGFLLTLQAL